MWAPLFLPYLTILAFKMMKKYIHIISGVLLGLTLWSCEDVIEVDLPKSEPVVVIDAWINNKAETQTIKVLRTMPYFDNSFLPGFNEATVRVEDLTDNVTYNFNKAQEDGTYTWQPTAGQPSLGKIGNEYRLVVQLGAGVYESFSTMNRVP